MIVTKPPSLRPSFHRRPSGSRAVTPCPTPTWTRAASATTPACASAATRCPVGGSTPGTLSQWRSGPLATATRTACCQCGRAKVLCVPVCGVVVCACVRNTLLPVFTSELIHRFITEHQQGKRVPLCINPQSAAFKTFIRSDSLSLFLCLSFNGASFDLLTCVSCVPGPRRGTRPRCPGRRRDERHLAGRKPHPPCTLLLTPPYLAPPPRRKSRIWTQTAAAAGH